MATRPHPAFQRHGNPPSGWKSSPLELGRFFLTSIPGSGNKSFIYANFLGYDGGPGSATSTFHVWLIK